MSPQEFANFLRFNKNIDASMIIHRNDARTLMLGVFNVDNCRTFWHVYTENNKLFRYIYGDSHHIDAVFVEFDSGHAEEFAPSGVKFMPQFCDKDFCTLLQHRGVEIQFDDYRFRDRCRSFYGSRPVTIDKVREVLSRFDASIGDVFHHVSYYTIHVGMGQDVDTLLSLRGRLEAIGCGHVNLVFRNAKPFLMIEFLYHQGVL